MIYMAGILGDGYCRLEFVHTLKAIPTTLIKSTGRIQF
jgi:hypothetical protein